MVLPGRLPVTVTRTYRTLDSDSGVFGIGWSSNFDLALQRAGNQISLILPGKTVVPFTLQTDGSFAALGDPGHRGSRITLASDGSATLRLKDGARWNFPAFVANFSQLRSMVDRNGNTIAVTRDSIGRVTALTEPGGRQIVFGYASGFGPISELRDPLGRSVGYEYDAQGRLARVTDPGGGVTQYTYDDQHRMVSTTDPRNITFTRNVFGASGRVIRQIQADGGETRFAYGTEMGTFYFVWGFGGRPRGRRLASSPRRRAVWAAHASVPNGAPRVRLCRMRASSASVMAAFTQVTSPPGRG
jgi:YD repeat-containing protein